MRVCGEYQVEFGTTGATCGMLGMIEAEQMSEQGTFECSRRLAVTAESLAWSCRHSIDQFRREVVGMKSKSV